MTNRLKLYLITPNLSSSILKKILESNLEIDYLQLRDYAFNQVDFFELADFCSRISDRKIKIILNQYLYITLLNSYREEYLLKKLKISGFHCSFRQDDFQSFPKKYVFFDNFISCHNLNEIERAHDFGFKKITLSPIFKTSSHPEVKPLGLEQFCELADSFSGEVFALGGVNYKNSNKLFSLNITGVAVISSFFK